MAKSKKPTYSELEAENAALKAENTVLKSENLELKKALANMSLLYTTVNELYQGQVKLVAYISKEVNDFELLKL